MPLDVGRVTHLLEQMHRTEDDAGDPITEDFLPAADGARGIKWVDPADLGSGGSSTLAGLTDVTVTTPQENDTLRYIGGEWVNDNRRWEPVTFNFGSGPELVWDGDDLVMEWKAY